MIFPAIYLASTSPRRKELLQQIGVDFLTLPITTDESVFANEPPTEYVARVALAKANAGLNEMRNKQLPERPILGADTAVVLHGEQILGKPESVQQASSYLMALSATQHHVISAVAVVSQSGFQQVVVQHNSVTFCPLDSQTIADYVGSGEGSDKAGGYAIQGKAAMFIKTITGSFSGIMGLPLYETRVLLQQVSQHEQ